MRDDRSDHTARFMQAIAAFSDEPEPVGELGRKIADHPDAAVSAILSEIDETVLRRNLTFVAQSGEMVQIDVAERRVFRVLAIPMDWRDAFAPLVGVDCSGRQGAELMQLFMMFAETASPIYVSADLPDRCKTAGFKGVTLRELREVYTDLKALSGLPAPFGDCARITAVAYDCELHRLFWSRLTYVRRRGVSGCSAFRVPNRLA